MGAPLSAGLGVAPCLAPDARALAGYQPVEPPRSCRSHIAETARLGDPDEPLAVTGAVGDVSASKDDALAELALPRLKAIAKLRR